MQPTPPNMPKVIPSVWISLVTAILGVLAAVGLPVSDVLSAAILTLTSAIAAVVPIVDAWLRRARLEYLAQQQGDTAGADVIVNNNPE